MANKLNERIASLRKEQGLTQEQLGQMVGVSPQAVSKWEKGGAPDVDLLPAVADALGVSIDALFGREEGEKITAADVARRWKATVPKDRQVEQLCWLVWSLTDANQIALKDEAEDANLFAPRSQSCMRLREDAENSRYLLRIRSLEENGIILGLCAEDMSYVSIFPEPKAGWAAFLEHNDRYRRLFALLARPHCLELLEYLNSKECYTARRQYTPDAVAAAIGAELEETASLLADLAELRVLGGGVVETREGPINCYQLCDDEALLPLLYAANWMTSGDGGWFNIFSRKSAVLRGEKQEEKEET